MEDELLKLHLKAMEFAYKAENKLHFPSERAKKFAYFQAFLLEKYVGLRIKTQPSRATILKSAVCLAIEAGFRAEARKLSHFIISEPDAPDDIKHELTHLRWE